MTFRLCLALFLTLAVGSVDLGARARLEVIRKDHRTRPERDIHPLMEHFGGVADPGDPRRTGNRLMIMLVEFQPDDDTRTTGNGMFMREAGEQEYPLSLGGPPHDQAFYDMIAESMRLYYLSASQQMFDLDYDIYPSEGYYQLPQEMTWYSPGTGSPYMIERFEQYFRDIMQTVDQDPEVTFGDYDHYLVIHAGSDWQHDVMGDTPNDIPSFFIRMGTGKEVWVDDGTLMMDHLCNVPETISQDYSVSQEDGFTFIDGFGVINAVMCHEFGHSLGFVDLYNTYNFRPMVGYWDIMDSGGQTLLTLEYPVNSDTLYSIEGGIPALPGAFSRMVAWGEEFLATGIARPVDDMNLTDPIEVIAAGAVINPADLPPNQAKIVRVNLSPTEYLLIENRQVDHDRDGPTSVLTDDPSDPRVIFCPVGADDNDNVADEWDYALPAWYGVDGYSYGGGLVVWHIDDDRLYNEGAFDANGEWYSNFDNNAVNTRYSERAVRVIEADGLLDIGNPYSLYWQGTSFEPFFRFMPLLDDEQTFQGWDVTPFAKELSADTKPALLTNNGTPSIWRIFDIDSGHYTRPFHVPPLIVSFRLGNAFFDQQIVLVDSGLESDTRIGSINRNNGSAVSIADLPVWGGGLRRMRHILDSGIDSWEDYDGEISFQQMPYVPGINVDWDLDGVNDYIVAGEGEEGGSDHLSRLDGSLGPEQIPLPDVLDDPVPMALVSEAGILMNVLMAGRDQVMIHEPASGTIGMLGIPAARMTATRNRIHLFHDGNRHSILQSWDATLIETTTLPFTLPDERLEPVSLVNPVDNTRNAVFVQSAGGDLWRFRQGEWERIFRLDVHTTDKPTQLALAPVDDDNLVCLVFGAGDLVFAVSTGGSLAPGFPVYLENQTLEPGAFPWAADLGDDRWIFLPGRGGGFYAVSGSGDYDPGKSLFWHRPESEQTGYERFRGREAVFYEEETLRLYFCWIGAVKPELEYQGAQDNRLFLSWLEQIQPGSLLWSGFRHNGTGLFIGDDRPAVTEPLAFTAYAFPNPVSTGQVRFRVQGERSSGIDLRIYDVAGNLVHEDTIPVEAGMVQDNIFWNTGNVASGVYFAIVRSGSEWVKVPIGVEK